MQTLIEPHKPVRSSRAASARPSFADRESARAGLVFFAVSLLAHTALGAGLYLGMRRAASAPIVAELDFSLAPQSPFSSRAGGGGKPSEAWHLAPKGKKAPPPPPPTAAAPAPAAEEVKAVDEAACHGDNCTGEGSGSGAGVGDGDGGVVDAVDAAQKPRWIRNMISSADYPRVARQAGKDGLVVLQVVLDESGRVRDARLLQGAYPALNDVALRKIQRAVFSPARNAAGDPVSCRVTLPIRFELR